LSASELEAGLELIRQSPLDGGLVEMIVRRPQTEVRERILEAELDPLEGLVGDNWKLRNGSRPPNLDAQITIMNARVAALVAQDQGRWQLAGDQLYIDLDLSVRNLPPGTRLALGTAVLEVTAVPHTGCAKFVRRFGRDAMTFVNDGTHQDLHLRGINTRVVQGGTVHLGDRAWKSEVR
jgi:MOSC domain-containing protein YiiM